MKVLHVVTLVSPDGAFGGPTRVAVNLCSALRDQGHDAVIAAGVNGFDEPPASLGGVPVHLFAARRVVPAFGHAPTYARWAVGSRSTRTSSTSSTFTLLVTW
jgi:hypothetical protein